MLDAAAMPSGTAQTIASAVPHTAICSVMSISQR
jgi:hypothetical protein